MNKPATDIKKLIKLETALTFTFIALIIGFLGGVVFSAFRMQNTSPISSMIASDKDHAEDAVAPEHDPKILEMEKKVAESPEDVNTWISLGNAYFDHKQPDKAIRAYETALKYQPNNADVWTDLGVMYRQNGKPEKAIAAFDKAQEVDPAHEMSLFNKGIVQMHDLNDPEGAAATWSKLLELNPSAKTQNGMLVKDLVENLKNMQ
jgi:cytochrome c-type biogenesis protein CcmH/NrfG